MMCKRIGQKRQINSLLLIPSLIPFTWKWRCRSPNKPVHLTLKIRSHALRLHIHYCNPKVLNTNLTNKPLIIQLWNTSDATIQVLLPNHDYHLIFAKKKLKKFQIFSCFINRGNTFKLRWNNRRFYLLEF